MVEKAFLKHILSYRGLFPFYYHEKLIIKIKCIYIYMCDEKSPLSFLYSRTVFSKCGVRMT